MSFIFIYNMFLSNKKTNMDTIGRSATGEVTEHLNPNCQESGQGEVDYPGHQTSPSLNAFMEYNKVWNIENKAAVIRVYKGSRYCKKGRWKCIETLDVL
jgi:hypothetical protein